MNRKDVKKLLLAAIVVVIVAKGETVVTEETLNDGTTDVPYIKLQPLAVTKGNIDATIIDSGFHLRVLSVKLDAPAPCRLDAPDLDLIYYASADCLHQHLQVI